MSNSIEEKEVCFDVAKTECAETKETIDTEICTYVYDEMEVDQPATTIEVEFEKKCQTHMVTVCEPGDEKHWLFYYITIIFGGNGEFYLHPIEKLVNLYLGCYSTWYSP